MRDFIRTQFYADWYKRVIKPPLNDYVLVISASSRTPVSGTGKTTKAIGWAKTLDRSEGGFDAESQATLSADEFANEVIPNAPEQAAVLIDEAQGTPGNDAGMNRMRAMSQATLDAVGGLLANRDKNLTVIIVVQQFHMLFDDFYPMIDSWMMITHEPSDPNGPSARHHRVYAEDYELGSGDLKTPVLESLSWPAVAHDDPDYQTMEEKKQQAKTKGGGEDEDVDEDLPKEQQQKLAQEYRDMGKSLVWIDENADAITYSREWIRLNTTSQSETEATADD